MNELYVLQVTETPAFVNTSPRPADAPNHSVRAMTGRRLGKVLGEASATDRALLAYSLVHGAVQLVRPTRVQAAALTKASLGYIDTITSVVLIGMGEIANTALERSGLGFFVRLRGTP